MPFGNIAFTGKVRSLNSKFTPQGVPVTTCKIFLVEWISKERNGQQVPCPSGWKESYNGQGWELSIPIKLTGWREIAERMNKVLENGRVATFVVKHAGKAANGYLNPNTWTGDDGVARAAFEYTVKQVHPEFGTEGEGNGGSQRSDVQDGGARQEAAQTAEDFLASFG